MKRVHWLLYELPTEFKGAYKLRWEYAEHKYIFYRMDGNTKKVYDIFIINRSKYHRYFRACYCNVSRNTIEFFGSRKPSMIAEKMYDLYLIDKALCGREE